MTPRRTLWVGDPHARVSDMEDCERLVDFVLETAIDKEVDEIVILGDLHHHHSQVHVRIVDFWLRSLGRLTYRCPVIALKGNHDEETNSTHSAHALLPYKALKDVTVVDKPMALGGRLFVPYMPTQDFVAACNAPPTNAYSILVCHQEFQGAQFEAGFYAPHGVEPEAIPQRHVISGHIHKSQEFGKVKYLGSPRWITAGDANQDRFIWTSDLPELKDDGGFRPINWQSFPTDQVLCRIQQIEDSPTAPASPEGFKPNWKYVVDIRGPVDWVEARTKAWTGHARIRTHVESTKAHALKESDGISTAFAKYLDGYTPKRGTSKERLAELAHERLQNG